MIHDLFKKTVKRYKKEGTLGVASSVYKMSNHPQFRNIKYRFQYSKGVSPMYATITIDPNEINYLVVPRFQRILHNRGYHIRGGDWDKRIHDQPIVFHANHLNSISKRGLVPFKNFKLYQSMKNRFFDGYDWEETEYYQWEKDMYEKGFRNSSEAAIKARCNRIDDLFESIQSDGYKTQREMREPVKYPERHEIMIDIGRHGQLLLDDGRHRMCIAKLLGLDSIPVKVLVRHKEWQKRRTKGAQNGIESLDENYKEHPDFSDIVSEKSNHNAERIV